MYIDNQPGNLVDGKYVYKYQHAALTADNVVFGFDGKALYVLLIQRGIEPYLGEWALPGGFMKMDETIEECAARELYEETGLRDVYLEQFRTFSKIKRDPRERVVTVAFIALVRQSAYQLIAGDDAADAKWFHIDKLPSLAFDHKEIITKARRHLMDIIRLRPIAFNLLDTEFTMPELQHIYEAINDTTYDRRNFARKMVSTGYVAPVSEIDDSDVLMNMDRCPMACESESVQISHARNAPNEESDSETIFEASISLQYSPKSKSSRLPRKRGRGRIPTMFSFLSDKFDKENPKEENNSNPFNL